MEKSPENKKTSVKKEASEQGWMDFQGPGFKMQVPTNWFISSSPQYQASFQSPEQKGRLSARLVINLQPIGKDFELQDARNMLQRIRQMIDKDALVLLEEDGRLDLTPAYHCLYKIQPKDAKKPILQRQMAAVLDNMLVTLTATRPAGPAEALDRSLAKMISSFKFTD